MAQFITRVELHGVNHDEATYQILHTEMGKVGFLRTITSGAGVAYHLPNAEYNLIGAYALNQILEKAKTAANKTNKKYSVIVSEINQATWDGLTTV